MILFIHPITTIVSCGAGISMLNRRRHEEEIVTSREILSPRTTPPSGGSMNEQEAERERDRDAAKALESLAEFANNYHNLLVVMQAAYIEWKYGEGAESAMEWIENTLDGPGLIPSPNMPKEAGEWSGDAQEFCDSNVLPVTNRSTREGKR